jgi:hypothetical protein
MVVKKNVTGQESFQYIRNQLDMGKTLSGCINALPIEKGNVFSFVPDGASKEQLFDFGRGGIYPLEKELRNEKLITPIRNDSKSLIVKEIQSHLNVNQNNCCLFEDTLSIPTDNWVITSQIEYIQLNVSEMLYFFDNNSNNEKKINESFSASEGYVFLCALSSLEPAERNKFVPYKEVSLELLKLFATNISKFFVKAYDGEGYLMWVSEQIVYGKMGL